MDHRFPLREKIDNLLQRTLIAKKMAEPGGVLPKIAFELLQQGGDAGLAPDLVSVLEDLVAQNKLDLPLDATKAENFKTDFNGLAVTALSAILTAAGKPGLAAISKEAIGFLKSKIDACGVLPNARSVPGPPVAQRSGQDVILYFVESGADGNAKLPEVNGSKTLAFGLLQKGFISWAKRLNLVVNFTPEQKDANLLVTGENLGKNTSVLARTEIGPPQGRQLRMVFNLDKTDLSAEMFESNVAHEFGHALGIVHEDVKQDDSQVMNSMLKGVRKPQGDPKKPEPRTDLAAAVFHGWQLPVV